MRPFSPSFFAGLILLLSLLSYGKKQESFSMLDRWTRKPVLASCLVDDMEEEGRWTIREGSPRLEYTRENVHDGAKALRQRISLVDSTFILDPANRTPWDSFCGEQGGWTCVALTFDQPQDWRAWNRISLWVYIHPSRNPNVSFALNLVNDSPDGPLTPGREMNPDIPQGKWCQVLWEIDALPRDRIIRFELCQTCTGYDREIGEQYVTIDFDSLELQRVETDHSEGWDISEGEIVFSHAGYRPADEKVALAAAGKARQFTLRNEHGWTVYRGDVQQIRQKGNTFACLDFSAFQKPGLYTLRYGKAESQAFTIGEDVWRRPLQAAVNFYQHQRCGYPVEGVHGVCHQDVMGFYREEKKPVNGGWHDAGDLSQGAWRTAYACYALLSALETGPWAEEAQALREEAAWGTDWLLKTRFADGRHMSWTCLRIYTDGEAGTFDDVVTPAEYVPWELFLTSAVFSRAAGLLEPARKQELEQAAVEDWEAAMQASPGWEAASYLEASWGAIASARLYECLGEERFRRYALHFSNLLLHCQEQDFVDGIPYSGYFYTNTLHQDLLHDHHAAFNEAPMLALSEVCRVFPEQSAPCKEAARRFVRDYLIPGSRLSAPYHLLPAGIFRKADMRTSSDLQQYEAGTRINADYAIRTFPIWEDHIFHGATHFHLSQAWALAAAAKLLDDREAMTLVQEQLEWTLGRNPFSSSLMYGVGYNYAPNYVYCTRHVEGAIPVGVDCLRDDAPFWNGTAHATSHEIWIEPVSRFVGTLAAFLSFQPSN